MRGGTGAVKGNLVRPTASTANIVLRVANLVLGKSGTATKRAKVVTSRTAGIQIAVRDEQD
jgi:hypothetical protein